MLLNATDNSIIKLKNGSSSGR